MSSAEEQDEGPADGDLEIRRPDLLDVIRLVAWMPAVPARGGEALVRRIFEPLGYEVEPRRSCSIRRRPNGETAATSSCA